MFLVVVYMIWMRYFKTTYSCHCRIVKPFVEHQIRKHYMQNRVVSTTWGIEFTNFKMINIQAS